jgi:hypothetical protein
MTRGLRRFTLTAHVLSSVGLVGSIASFLALAITALITQQAEIVRAVYPAMDLTARLVILPLAVASLLTGLVQSLGTPWGLFRHYWVVAKLLITVFATVVLYAKLVLIEYAAGLVALPSLPVTELQALGTELVVHATGGLFVLLVPTALSIYKPKGLTPYGCRRQQVRISPTAGVQASTPPIVGGVPSRAGPASITLTLRRAYLYGIVVLIAVLHIVILHANGVGLHGN